MCAGGALGPGLGAGGGPGGSGLARQRPLFFPPSPRPWRDRPSGPQAGSGRAPLGGRATVTPRARGPFSLGPLGGAGGGGQGCLCVLELPVPGPSRESRRRLFRDRGWVAPWLDGPSLFPLPLVVSGACGTEGRESGIRASSTSSDLDWA